MVAALVVLGGGGYSRGYGDVGGCACVAAVAAGTIKWPPVMGVCKLLESQTNPYIRQTLCSKMRIRGETRMCVRGRAPMSAAGLQPFIRTDKEATHFFAILSNHVEAKVSVTNS